MRPLVISKQQALREQHNDRSMQYKRWTATVYADGEVFAKDDNVREWVEAELYYSVPQERWLARTVPGVTIICA